MHARPRPAFSLVELLVCLAIIALLLALLLPSLHAVRQSMWNHTCVSNEHGVLTADSAYAAAHKGKHAPGIDDLDIGYGPQTICPLDPRDLEDQGDFSYVFLWQSRPGVTAEAFNETQPYARILFLSDDFRWRHGLRAGEKYLSDYCAQWERSWRNKGRLDGSVFAMRGPQSTCGTCP